MRYFFRYSAIIILAICTLTSCESGVESTDLVEATVTGIDFRRCACCGGAMLTLSDDGTKYSAPYYQWHGNLEKFGIPTDSEFPMPVLVKFDLDEDQCAMGSLGIIQISELLAR